MSINYQEAKKIALEYIELNQIPIENQLDGNKMILCEEETIEKEYGWYFFWSPSMLLKTGDLKYVAIGNTPFLVTKDDGNIITFGTAQSIEYYINEYEEKMKNI